MIVYSFPLKPPFTLRNLFLSPPAQKKKTKTPKKSQGLPIANYILTAFISIVFFLLFLIFFVDFRNSKNKASWLGSIKSVVGGEQESTDRKNSILIDKYSWKNLNDIGVRREQVFKSLQTLKKIKNTDYFFFEYTVWINRDLSSTKVFNALEQAAKKAGGRLSKFLETSKGKQKKIVVDISIPSEHTAKGLVLSHRFVFVTKKKYIVARRDKKTTRKTEVAILIDDVGYSKKEVDVFFDISPKITLSIIPGLPFSGFSAAKAKSNGQVVMIHIPMEAKTFPSEYARKGGPTKEHMLFTSFSDWTIRSMTRKLLNKVPSAVGINNHMGSKFTENEKKMRVVLEEVKKAGLFFVDSLTSSRSKGKSLCKAMGIPFAVRNIFIDNSSKMSDMQKQLDKALKRAEKYGKVLAIGHPRTNTIKAIRRFVKNLDKSRFTLVPVSRLVKRQ